MSEIATQSGRVVGVEGHAWVAEFRDALRRFGGDDTVSPDLVELAAA